LTKINLFLTLIKLYFYLLSWKIKIIIMVKNCSFCGSEKITNNVKMYCDGGSNYPLRAYYINPKKSLLKPKLPEYFYAEICNNCGSINRMYAETPHDDWDTGKY
jgi:hypothetical protein